MHLDLTHKCLIVIGTGLYCTVLEHLTKKIQVDEEKKAFILYLTSASQDCIVFKSNQKSIL